MKTFASLLFASSMFVNFAFGATAVNEDPELVKTIEVSPEASKIVWNAYKVTGEHEGTIDIHEGEFVIEDGKLTGGEFVIDMTSIEVTDLSGNSQQKLEGHLRSEDFFSVEKFPTAKFVITEVTPGGVDRYKVEGDLTIKGITKPIKFIANMSEENGMMVATADIRVDRSEYNVRYGSGSFFDNLGDKTIYDEFDLKVKIAAR